MGSGTGRGRGCSLWRAKWAGIRYLAVHYGSFSSPVSRVLLRPASLLHFRHRKSRGEKIKEEKQADIPRSGPRRLCLSPSGLSVRISLGFQISLGFEVQHRVLYCLPIYVHTKAWLNSLSLSLSIYIYISVYIYIYKYLRGIFFGW